MIRNRRQFSALALSLPLAWTLIGPARALARRSLVIATGGRAADIPEGTKGAYELAIQGGADVIAAWFAPTRDGVLVAVADHELSAATDIATRPEFADRRQTHVVEGRERIGWFVEDFALGELKTLTRSAPVAKRRAGGKGDAGRAILTFEELVAIARAGSVANARVVGVQAGLPHPAYFAARDLALEPRLAGAIRVAGYDSPAAAMWVMSEDGDALATIGGLARVRRVLFIGSRGLDALSPAVLRAGRTRSEVVAIAADRLLDLTTTKTYPPTSVIADAHAAGYAVQAWTTGGAQPFPPPPYRPDDMRRLLAALFAADTDAVAGDLATPIARARAAAMPETRG